MLNVREIPTARLIWHLAARPYDIYCEAMRRKGDLLENPRAWAPKRLAKTEKDCAILTRTIHAYYDFRAAS